MSADVLTPGKAGSPGSAETSLALVSRRRWRGVRAGVRREYSRKCSLWDVAVGVPRKSGVCMFRFVERDERTEVSVASRVGGGVGSVGERKQVGAREGLSVLKDCGVGAEGLWGSVITGVWRSPFPRPWSGFGFCL